MTELSKSGRDRVAAIIVNYGTADLTITAVESLLGAPHGDRDLVVHVVDNASPNGDGETLREAHETREWRGRVTLWIEDQNHGFGRGNNVVLKALSVAGQPPDKVFLLNPDARLHNNTVDVLAQCLDGDPRAAGAGASILRPDQTRAVAAFRFPGFRSEIARAINLNIVNRLFSEYLIAMPVDQKSGVVDWVSGAAVMFRFEALREVDFFDPGFFLYYEEVDLMRRLKAVGWCIHFVEEAKVIHVEGAATGQFASQEGRQRNPVYLYQSWAHYFRRALGRPKALCLAVLLWPATGLNILHRRLRGRSPQTPLGFFQDHWRFVVRPLLTGQNGS